MRATATEEIPQPGRECNTTCEIARCSIELLSFERLISGLSAKFINLPTSEIDREIEHGLEKVAMFIAADRAALLDFTGDNPQFIQTHRWAHQGVSLLPNEVVNGGLPWVTSQFRAGIPVVFPRLSELPEEASVDRDSFANMRQVGLIGLPLEVGGKVIGTIGYAFFKPQRPWSEELIERLKLVGGVFGNALSRKLNEEALKRAISELTALKNRLVQENLYLQQEISSQFWTDKLTGTSALINKVLKEIKQVACSNTTVLILGETGTGKELVARLIHETSSRSGRPLVKVNCAALPSNLIESELFGHEKGAFTGAIARKIGRFELADKGTIFLDEIGDLQFDLQVKLLRVLQEKEIERVGSNTARGIDVRIITATNRDLKKLVSEGKFREDLYYRLNVFPIHCPALRERAEDIPQLVCGFVREFCKKTGKQIHSVSDQAMFQLVSYRWPGNVRELKNVVERATLLSNGPNLEIGELLKSEGTAVELANGFTTLQEVEAGYILDVLKFTRWRVSGERGAAKILGLKAKTLESKMKKLSIHRPR